MSGQEQVSLAERIRDALDENRARWAEARAEGQFHSQSFQFARILQSFEEFASLDIPFKERAPRTEECVKALRQLWGEKAEPFSGRFYNWDAIESNPKPVQAGGVPIVVGGHVEGAARRAARIADGFFPAAGDLPKLFSIVREECEKIGRDPSEVELTAGGALRSLDDVKRLEDMGVSRIITAPPGFDEDAVEKGLEKLGDDILSKV